MYDQPHAYSIGARDVVAAWLLCLAIAGALFIYRPVDVAMPESAVAAQTLPRTAAPPTEICGIGQSLVRMPRG